MHPLLLLVIFENHLVIPAAVQSVELAVVVVLWCNPVLTYLTFELVEDLLRVLVDRFEAKDVEEKEHAMVGCEGHLGADKNGFVTRLRQIYILGEVLGAQRLL